MATGLEDDDAVHGLFYRRSVEVNRAFRRFCLKSNRKVTVWFGLVALAHNLREVPGCLIRADDGAKTGL